MNKILVTASVIVIAIVIVIVLLSFGLTCFFIFINAMTPAGMPVNSSEIIGTYRANYIGMIDSLILSRDGTFRHYFYDSSGGIYTESGRWEPYTHKKEINLNSFHNIRLIGICRRYNCWTRSIVTDSSDCGMIGTAIYKIGDTVRMAINIDLNLYYERVH